MTDSAHSVPRKISFGLYEIDLESRDLTRNGQKIRLQGQPFQVLATLIEHSGKVVTRDDLRQRIWGDDTIVDFDQALSTAIAKIREALRDSPEDPKFIQTIPRRGYRFLAPTTAVLLPESPSQGSFLSQPIHVTSAAAPLKDSLSLSSTVGRPRFDVSIWLLGVAIVILLIAGVVLGFAIGSKYFSRQVPEIRQLTFDRRAITPVMSGSPIAFRAGVCDGTYIYSSAIMNGHAALVQTPVAGGESREIPVPPEIVDPEVGDISPDHTRLLLLSHSSNSIESPLWILSLANLGAQRVPNVLAHAATWMPGGADVLFAANNALYVAVSRSARISEFTRLPGQAYWLRWSPDGSLLRFTIADAMTGKRSLWELTSGAKTPKLLLDGGTALSNPCCGVWDSHSRFVFTAGSEKTSDIWELKPGHGAPLPVPITRGPLDYEGPVSDSLPGLFYVTGSVARPNVETFDTEKRIFRAAPDFILQASELEYSRDMQWVVWVDKFGRLWRAKADGRDRLQLTPDNLRSYMARWSPDGSHIAVMAREPERPWQIYLLSAEGGDTRELTNEPYNVADPTWSPDGKKLAFGSAFGLASAGAFNNSGQNDSLFTIHLLDLQTGKTSVLPGATDVFSPRWSPDGRYLLALTGDQKRLILYDVTLQRWSTLGSDSYSNPTWSSDSRFVYVQNKDSALDVVMRISVPDGRYETVCDLKNLIASDATDYSFIGLAPGNRPIARTRVTGDLFSIQLGMDR